MTREMTFNAVSTYRDDAGELHPRCSTFQEAQARRDAYARNPYPRESRFEKVQWFRHCTWLAHGESFLPRFIGSGCSEPFSATVLPEIFIPLHENDPWEFVR